jgi:hypothetical protein
VSAREGTTMNDDERVSRRHPVEEDMPMQQRVWRFERVGWYALVLIVLMGTFSS